MPHSSEEILYEKLKLAMEKEKLLLECINAYAEKFDKILMFCNAQKKKEDLSDAHEDLINFLEKTSGEIYDHIDKVAEIVEKKNG